MTLSSLPYSIHGNLNYINYQYTFNAISFIVLLSQTSVFFTILIVLRMLKKHRTSRATNASRHVQISVFNAFIWMQTANLFFYIFDNIAFRIPPTGLLTPWLALTSPALFLKISYYFLLIFNYLSTSFSLLFCLIRFLVVYFPESNRTKLNQLHKFYIPASFLLPFLCTLFFIPAKVYCRQISPPYRFGALYFFYVGAWRDIYYDPFNVLVNISSTLAIVVINIALLNKIRIMIGKKRNRSSRSFKSEISLTLMTITINIPFIANAIMTIISLSNFFAASYTLLPRQVIIDIGLVGVPLIFYVTHPMFARNQVSISASQASSERRRRENVKQAF